jgi:hypothetical protein
MQPITGLLYSNGQGECSCTLDRRRIDQQFDRRVRYPGHDPVNQGQRRANDGREMPFANIILDTIQ